MFAATGQKHPFAIKLTNNLKCNNKTHFLCRWSPVDTEQSAFKIVKIIETILKYSKDKELLPPGANKCRTLFIQKF